MSIGAVNQGQDASFVAEVAMATQYTAVKLGSDTNSVDLADATTDNGIGITQTEQATVDGLVTVRLWGFSLARCSGGWTKGDKLTGTTGGALATTTTAANVVNAIAAEAATDGENGLVLIVSPGVRYDSF